VSEKPATIGQKRARRGTNCEFVSPKRPCGEATVQATGIDTTVRICDRHWKILMDLKDEADAKAGKKPRKALRAA